MICVKRGCNSGSFLNISPLLFLQRLKKQRPLPSPPNLTLKISWTSVRMRVCCLLSGFLCSSLLSINRQIKRQKKNPGQLVTCDSPSKCRLVFAFVRLLTFSASNAQTFFSSAIHLQTFFGHCQYYIFNSFYVILNEGRGWASFAILIFRGCSVQFKIAKTEHATVEYGGAESPNRLLCMSLVDIFFKQTNFSNFAFLHLNFTFR